MRAATAPLNGSEAIVNTYFTDLVTDGTGAVLGAIAQGKDVSFMRIDAKPVVITTGILQPRHGWAVPGH